MADRYAESFVLFEGVVFEKAMTDAPAEEESVFAVMSGDAVADGGALGAGAGVQAERGIVFADAVDDLDVVGLLEADTVAIIVSDGAV